MINKSFGNDWVFGSKFWDRQHGLIREPGNGKVLDIEGGVASIGSPVILFPKHGGANQKWEEVPISDDLPWYKLRNPASGLCLQVTNFGHDLTVGYDYHHTVGEGGIYIVLVFFFFHISKLAAHLPGERKM